MPSPKCGTDVPEDNDLIAVHPLPLGPVPASKDSNGLIAVQPLQPGSAPASTEFQSIMLSSTAMSSSESFYSDSQWTRLQTLGLDTLAGYALDGGPTVSGRWGDGDFTAMAKEKLLVGTDWHQTGLAFYDKMELRSAGLLVTDADQLTIDAESLIDPVYSNGGKNGWHHLKTHYLYTAIDASNAEDYVTYQGVTKNHWQGNTSATGKSYDFHNIFKGGDFGNDITGGNYGDTLIGGEGNDTINGVGGDNIIYGVGGDNRIDGGSGSSTIFGGTGDDFIVTGKGSNTVVLGNGNNWVVVDQNNLDGTTNSNKIMLGSGTDTVVIGNIPPSETTVTSSMSEWQMGLVTDTTIDTTSNFFGWAIEELGATNPLWGMMLTAGTDLISTLVGGTPSQVVETTDYPVFEATEIYDFNPLTDRLLLPMNAEGSTNLAVKVEADGHDLTIYDYNSNTVLAYVDFASAAEIFGTSGSLSSIEKKAFGEALLSSVLIMDSDGLTVGSGDATNDFSVDASDIASIGSFSDDIGAGRYMFLGAWNGNHMFGDSTYKTYMGTEHNDVLFSFDVTGDSINAATGGGAKFYGFSGNNLFATGTGHNLVFGGTGEDTVTYQYAFGAINADMTVLSIDPDNPSHGTHFTVTQDLEGFHEDYLWDVQNLIGSEFGDTIIGSDEDNTLVSTGGSNTWTGTGGSNTFVLNGGSAHITDFSAGADTIVIDELSYADSSSNVDYGATLTWIEGENDWTLFDNYNSETLAVLDKNDNFDQPTEITLITNDNGEWVYTPETYTYIDLVA
uniref:calcium-binding protein n=1 Tax=uncultured Roseibium sp. TaxID=1936171 RepID=UPI00345D2973